MEDSGTSYFEWAMQQIWSDESYEDSQDETGEDVLQDSGGSVTVDIIGTNQGNGDKVPVFGLQAQVIQKESR